MKTIRMKTYIALILLLISHNINAQKYSCKTDEVEPFEINEKISPNKLIEDIDEFIKILEEVHVNPYMKISKEEFYNATLELKNSIKDS